jgi:AMMECR1 domain-containing protein
MSPHAKLAKSVVEQYIKARTAFQAPGHLPAEFAQQRACYVYLLENPGKRLRAMYGQPLPRRASLEEEIITNTTGALLNQLSSPPIRRAELASLAYTVAVLDPLQRISDPAQLNPILFGLVVKSDSGKSAVLLPGRAGIETPHDQIATALREAGIHTRQETVAMYRFGVSYYD